MKFEVDKELIEEMACCIFDCNWVSPEEVAAYMMGCVTDTDFNPEDWSFDGRGKMSVDRSVVIENGEDK